jgi:hypothetical protein
MSISELAPNELLFYTEEDNGGTNGKRIMSGGYSVDSYLLQQGISPMQTLNNTLEGGGRSINHLVSKGKPSSIFENLAIPTGLFLINQKPMMDNYTCKNKSGGSHQMLPDNIFDEFMKMIEIDKTKKRNRKTRRPDLESTNKKTRRLGK